MYLSVTRWKQSDTRLDEKIRFGDRKTVLGKICSGETVFLIGEEMKTEKQQCDLETKLEYRFKNRKLLETALRHSSFTNEHRMPRVECNERLEFLGDAVLELVSSEFLYQTYPDYPEGELTKFRASLVCEPTLAYDARQICLGEYLMLGKGEDNSGGRRRDSIVSDALEAIIGAIYLDGGLECARTFIIRHVLNDIQHKQLFYDSKTILQEIVQGNMQGEIVYQLLGEDGPDHDKTFTTEVQVNGQMLGTGKGRTKKAAEQAAAYHAICELKKK